MHGARWLDRDRENAGGGGLNLAGRQSEDSNFGRNDMNGYGVSADGPVTRPNCGYTGPVPAIPLLPLAPSPAPFLVSAKLVADWVSTAARQYQTSKFGPRALFRPSTWPSRCLVDLARDHDTGMTITYPLATRRLLYMPHSAQRLLLPTRFSFYPWNAPPDQADHLEAWCRSQTLWP